VGFAEDRGGDSAAHVAQSLLVGIDRRNDQGAAYQ